jgi:uncharacterized membrane protein
MTAESGSTQPPVIRTLGVWGNERIGAFSDGVFAIAITLLVLELKVPEHVPAGGLVTLLPEILPKILGHVISFAVLGLYWVAHHNMFLHIKRHDRVLLWLNILFLLFVASMPFLAGLIAEHGGDQFAVIAYAGTLVLAGLVLDLIWAYATHERRLVDPGIDADLVAAVHRRVLMAPAIYLLAIVVSFVSLVAAKLIVFVVLLVYIVPSPLDSHHRKQLGTPK